MHVPAKGRLTKLSIEDQILLCLSYWREYRTLFYVATSSEGVQECHEQEFLYYLNDLDCEEKGLKKLFKIGVKKEAYEQFFEANIQG